jgi:hypothetical protein
MRDYYNINIKNTVSLNFRHTAEAAIWDREEQSLIDGALPAEAEAAKKKEKGNDSEIGEGNNEN